MTLSCGKTEPNNNDRSSEGFLIGSWELDNKNYELLTFNSDGTVERRRIDTESNKVTGTYKWDGTSVEISFPSGTALNPMDYKRVDNNTITSQPKAPELAPWSYKRQ